MRSDSSQSSQGSVWTMLVVVMISIPIVWELFQRNENTGLRTLRLLAAIVAIVCLASAAYIKEYLARRELAFHFGWPVINSVWQCKLAHRWRGNPRRSTAVIVAACDSMRANARASRRGHPSSACALLWTPTLRP